MPEYFPSKLLAMHFNNKNALAVIFNNIYYFFIHTCFKANLIKIQILYFKFIGYQLYSWYILSEKLNVSSQNKES